MEGRRGIQSLVRIILVPAAQQRDKDPTIRNWPPELFNIGLFPSAWYQALRTFATLHNPDASPRAKKKSPEWLGHVILDSILDSGFRMWSLRTDKLRVLWADSPERHHLDFDHRGRDQWKKAVSRVIGCPVVPVLANTPVMIHHHNLRPRLGDTPPGPDQIKRWEDFGIPLAEDQIAEVLNLHYVQGIIMIGP